MPGGRILASIGAVCCMRSQHWTDPELHALAAALAARDRVRARKRILYVLTSQSDVRNWEI